MITAEKILKESIEKAYYHKMFYFTLFIRTDSTKYFHNAVGLGQEVVKLEAIAPAEVIKNIDYTYIRNFAIEDAEEFYDANKDKF